MLPCPALPGLSFLEFGFAELVAHDLCVLRATTECSAYVKQRVDSTAVLALCCTRHGTGVVPRTLPCTASNVWQ